MPSRKDVPQKGRPVPDEAAIRERVLRKNEEAPDLAVLKDFPHFQTSTNKGLIVAKPTCDALNTFAE